MERELQRRHPGWKIRAINAGIPGYSTQQGYNLLKNLVNEYHPDIVTVYYGWNDHWMDLFSDRQKLLLNRLDYYLDRSVLFTLIKKAVKGDENCRRQVRNAGLWQRLRKKDTVRVSLPRYRDNLLHIVDLIRSNGAKEILITAPSYAPYAEPDKGWFESQPYSTYSILHPRYIQALREVARYRNAHLFDLARILDERGKDRLFADFIHFNWQGHEVAGRLLAGYVDGEQMIPAGPPEASMPGSGRG
jgi:lysophospholipase L1-like esterase